jgi:hypothetical protein
MKEHKCGLKILLDTYRIRTGGQRGVVRSLTFTSRESREIEHYSDCPASGSASYKHRQSLEDFPYNWNDVR